jgi:hypothetical protein
VSNAPVVSDQFWPVTAQVIPVLALAIIIEARTTMQRWPADFPLWLRRVQGALWIAPLAVFAAVEPLAFNELAGQNESHAWVSTAILGISLSVGALITAPAIGLVFRTNPRAFARAFIGLAGIWPSWKIQRVSRKNAALLREVQGLREERLSELAELDEIEQKINSSKKIEPKEAAEILAESSRLRHKVHENIKRLDESESRLVELAQKIGSSREGLNDFLKESQELLEKGLAEQGLEFDFKPPELPKTVEGGGPESEKQ